MNVLDFARNIYDMLPLMTAESRATVLSWLGPWLYAADVLLEAEQPRVRRGIGYLVHSYDDAWAAWGSRSSNGYRYLSAQEIRDADKAGRTL